MEIKCIEKEKVEYPKMNEMSKKKLKDSIPNKWMKLGITTFVFQFLLKNKVLAETPEQTLAGDVVVDTANPPNDIGTTTIALTFIDSGITIGSIVMFVVCLIGVILTSIRLKKDSENKKIKVLKIVFEVLLIISVLVFAVYQIFFKI